MGGCHVRAVEKFIHGRALRIIYQDYNSSFPEFVRKDNSLTIH